MYKADTHSIVVEREGRWTRSITTQSGACDPSVVAINISNHAQDNSAWVYLPKAEAVELVNDLIRLIADLED